MQEQLIPKVADLLSLQKWQVEHAFELLNEGATIPFISRYRKERTGSLDEVQVGAIQTEKQRLEELLKRKESILSTIAEQEKLSPELEKRILNCWNGTELEDIYLPYKPKRKTKASVAREKGLEPLAKMLMSQNVRDVEEAAQRFAKGEVASADEALQGARDIIAEWVNESERARGMVRKSFEVGATIQTKVVKAKEEEGIKYKDYFDWNEPLKKCPSHRMLAMMRAEKEGFVRLNIGIEEERCLERLDRQFVRSSGDAADQIQTAVKDAYKRLLSPSMENEFFKLHKEKADKEAIEVFAENLRQLLLAAPLGQKRVLALDPGFRTGCKLVCLDAQGNLRYNSTIYPHPPQNKRSESAHELEHLLQKYQIEAIAIGDGTAGRETESFVKSCKLPEGVGVYLISEDGASIYSASEVARAEFPDYDVTVRGAVSIGRRLIDPLAELVKIDAKSIGVGQYQHDVDQKQLRESLDRVVESAVNSVGVNVNTASKQLLSYVSGLGAQLAQNVVDYRAANGAFQSRAELKKVPRLGAKAFEQCAGFLRISQAKNPLDNSAVHPEAYALVGQMAKDLKCSVADLIGNEQLVKSISLQKYVSESVGLPTLQDISKELLKPGLDPREQLTAFSFANIYSMDDLHEGMVLPGIVTNITKFGAFVDIGLKQDGLVHISQMADKYISDPSEVVKLRQQVTVRVAEVDLARQRIQLSMRGL
ncbi:MAG: Tex family protein [Mangrovibacterium sp.]